MNAVAAALARQANGRATESFGLWCVDLPPTGWRPCLRAARDDHGLTYLDWLSGSDDGADGVSIVAHVLDPDTMTHLLLRTSLSSDLRLDSVTPVHAGASWHERETAEMYGVTFDGHPDPRPLLLAPEFEGHPLRKDFVLAARVVKAWPGSHEPAEPGAGRGTVRRRPRPPGVPDPADWGPGAADV